MGVFNNFPYANFHELNADWIIEQVRKVMDEWEEYKTDMNLWKLGVDDQLAEFQAWFDNLDVQDEVRTVMNELILSGEFIEITSPQIVSATEAWLAAHITPTTPAVDDTLSISGAAADAKVTGDRITDLKEDIDSLDMIREELKLPLYFTKWGQGSWSSSHVWTNKNDRVSFYPDIYVEKGTVVRIDCPTAEKFARASWRIVDGQYVNVRFDDWTTGFLDWVVEDNLYISVVVAKSNGEDLISPETVGTNIVIFNKDDMLDPLNDSIYIKKQMSEVYERKEVSTMGNSYEIRTEEKPNRGRVKKEYIQAIPENATQCLVVFSYEAMANGKYKIGFAFYTENYQQIASSVIGWETTTYSVRFKPDSANVIPADAKYFMFYYATVNDDDEVDFSEIDFTKNYIIFDNSPINYTRELLNQSVSKELMRIKSDIDTDVVENTFIYSINHRGYSGEAPENTLPAFVMSKAKGFYYVETDVLFTSDNVPVLLHDASINRTARNADGTAIDSTVYISDITYAQALTYDFGIWKGQKWAGIKIPTFAEFITICKQLSLHPFIELKDETTWTNEKCEMLADTIKTAGMSEHVTFLSFSTTALSQMSSLFSNAILCLGCHDGSYGTTDFADFINDAVSLKTNNTVLVSVKYTSMTNTLYEMLNNAKLNSIAWTVNTESEVLNLNTNTNGVLSDLLNAGEIIINNLIEELP